MLRRALLGVGLVAVLLGSLSFLGSFGLQPRLPIKLGGEDCLVVVAGDTGVPSPFMRGDHLVAIDSHPLADGDHLEFLLDGYRGRQPVNMTVFRDNRYVTFGVVLTGGIPTAQLAINVLVGGLFWLFGMLVVWQGRLERDVLLFFAMAMTLSLTIMVHSPDNDLGLGNAGRVLGALLSHGLYPLTVTLLLHFSIFFPAGAPSWVRWPLGLAYLVSFTLSGWLLGTMMSARAEPLTSNWTAHRQALQALHLYLPTVFALSPLLWLVKLFRSPDTVTRKKLKWLLWGFAVGISPHLLLFELPQGLGHSAILPELVTIPMAVIAAASVLVAVARYRLLDINLVINRSIVYLLLSAALVTVYLVLVAIGDAWLAGRSNTSSFWVRIPVVLLLALAFAPARQLAQDWVDRLFFRRRHDQRLALMELSRLAASILEIDELSQRVVALVKQVLGVDRVTIFFATPDRQELQSLAAEHPGSERITVSSDLAELFHGEPVLPANRVAEMKDFALLAALLTGQGLIGLLAVGSKLSGEVFDDEDFRFLEAVAAQTALAFERARVIQQLRDINRELEQKVYERTAQLNEAKDRLVEQYQQLQRLDELKESMTRMVVHDLRNPLTTIALGSELALNDCAEVPEPIKRTLQLIQETASHMGELLQSMLDTARIEAGTLQVERKPVNPVSLLRECAERLHILAGAKHVNVVVEESSPGPCELDAELMGRVLVNLLANSIRHSPAHQRVIMQVRRREDGCLDFCVSNLGPPIPAALQQRIFDKFFRATEKSGHSAPGAGLGLHFCRMIAEAHGGSISVVSPLPGRSDGASFIVTIPAVSK